MKLRLFTLLSASALILVSLSNCERMSGPPKFVAVGKVICTQKAVEPKKSTTKPFLTLTEFVTTQTEIIESGELRRRALDRVRTMNPELKEIDVVIHVTQTKDSAILNVAGIGEEAKYTRVFVSALLDEYIAFHKEMFGRPEGGMNKIVEEVLSREKQIRDVAEKLEEARKANAPPVEIARLESAYASAKEGIEPWRKALEHIERDAVVIDTAVAIMERPTIAVETR